MLEYLHEKYFIPKHFMTVVDLNGKQIEDEMTIGKLNQQNLKSELQYKLIVNIENMQCVRLFGQDFECEYVFLLKNTNQYRKLLDTENERRFRITKERLSITEIKENEIKVIKLNKITVQVQNGHSLIFLL